MQKKQQHILICLVLIIATAIVYGQVRHFEFVCYDDDTYIINNPHVTAGLTAGSMSWAFSAAYAGTWQPLTWLSFMLDHELYGLDSGGYHATNLLLHLANALLLYAVLAGMTGACWRSAFVAALFALHPLHVESVAWAVERKDVLSTLFWMLTLLSYVRFTARPGLVRYLLLACCYILGLMSKPMLVTLPVALLLLDWWPLGRLQKPRAAVRCVREKLPLFGLAAASAIATFLVQQRGGAVGSLEIYPLDARIANALVAYAAYLLKMLWPFNLAVLYPHPGLPPWWQTAGAGIMLAVISALVLRSARRHPYLPMGWLWYLGTLVPVIGLVQIGLHAMADRFTYVPLVGIFIMLAWGLPELLSGWRYRPAALAAAGTALLILLATAARQQAGYWRTSVTLFERALAVTAGNFVAHNNLGIALAEQGRRAEAMQHYIEALRINSAFAEANNNLGFELARQGRLDEAISYYSQALRSSPRLAKTHYNLAHALSERDRKEQAIQHYAEALRLKPDFTKARINLGLLLADEGRLDEAISNYREALRLDPQGQEAHFNLGIALARQGRPDEAVSHYTQALRIDPNDAQVYNSMGLALISQGKIEEAVRCFRNALEKSPDSIDAHNNLGAALAQQGTVAEAITHYQIVVRDRPQSAEARNNLGAALARQGRLPEAIQQYTTALQLSRDNADIYVNLASALIKTGRFSEAIEHLKQAIRLRPDDVRALNNLGAVMLHVGRKKEAAACFQQVLRIDPEHALARDNLNRLTGPAQEAR